MEQPPTPTLVQMSAPVEPTVSIHQRRFASDRPTTTSTKAAEQRQRQQHWLYDVEGTPVTRDEEFVLEDEDQTPDQKQAFLVCCDLDTLVEKCVSTCSCVGGDIGSQGRRNYLGCTRNDDNDSKTRREDTWPWSFSSPQFLLLCHSISLWGSPST
jgi:hypothetical protein